MTGWYVNITRSDGAGGSFGPFAALESAEQQVMALAARGDVVAAIIAARRGQIGPKAKPSAATPARGRPRRVV